MPSKYGMQLEHSRGLTMARKRFTAFLAAILFVSAGSLFAQENTADFDKFYTSFKDAVSRKDTAELTKMMATHFDFFQARNVTSADVFKHLDAEDEKQWANLQDAVKIQPSDFPDGYFGKPARVVKCTPANATYYCWVVFTQDKQGDWRWKAMVMPERVHNLPVPGESRKPKK